MRGLSYQCLAAPMCTPADVGAALHEGHDWLKPRHARLIARAQAPRLAAGAFCHVPKISHCRLPTRVYHFCSCRYVAIAAGTKASTRLGWPTVPGERAEGGCYCALLLGE